MVTTHITSQRTVITIENYSNYQDKPTPKGTLKGTPNDTPNDTAEEHQTTHNKERYKKDKESYKNVFIRANTHPYGKLKNVYLTDSEYAEIQEYQNYNILLDEVGTWLLNNNRNNHYGTMITFAKNNSYKKKPKPEPPKEPIKAEPMPKEVREKMKKFRNDKTGGIMNTVNLIGRLTADPKVTYIPSSQMAVAKFSIAIDRPQRQGAEKQTDFPRITVFGKQAENCEKYLTKGRLVGVQGRLQTGFLQRQRPKDCLYNRCCSRQS